MNSHPRPIPANLYTTRRIGPSHYKDPESKTLFSQGKYPTKLTYRDLPGCFLSGTYYGTKGYLRTDSIKGLWYQPCYHTNHMFKDDFLLHLLSAPHFILSFIRYLPFLP